jgi:hypothetical protein
MTDERYIYQQDIREKNSTKSGAYHRVSGAKSKRCTLPSDHLTAAEMKRRNSPVSSIKLNQPITYEEFKTLTPTLQALYLDHLIHEYHARRIDVVQMLGISQSMWGKIKPTIPCKLDFPKGKHEPAPEWLAFIGGEAEEITPPPMPSETPAAEPETAQQEEILLTPPILSGSITMVAALPDLLSQLTRLVEEDTAYQFTVTFARV